jgi:hypothetical protein
MMIMAMTSTDTPPIALPTIAPRLTWEPLRVPEADGCKALTEFVDVLMVTEVRKDDVLLDLNCGEVDVGIADDGVESEDGFDVDV